MKRKLFFIFLMMVTVTFGQKDQEEQPKLNSRYRPGIMWWYTGLKPAKGGDAEKYDRLMFDVTYNDWAGERGSFKLKGPSMGMNVSFMFDIPLGKSNQFSFAIGPQYGFFNTRHDLAYAFDFDEKATFFDVQENVGEAGYTKFVGNYFQIPIEFRFRTKGWEHFKIHIGGKIGYLFAFNHKTKWSGEDFKAVQRDYSTPDLNRLLYSAHIRFGIRNWGLYASYSFNPMFKNEQSTQVNQFQLGLTVSLF